MDFIRRTADGKILSSQDKRGALAISPTIVLLYNLEVVVEIVIFDPAVVGPVVILLLRLLHGPQFHPLSLLGCQCCHLIEKKR